MNCLIELCFVSALYLDGALGQQLTYDGYDPKRTNKYGDHIGEISLVLELKNGLYVEAKHISGINTEEPDYGLNSIMIGARINLFGEN